MVEVVGDFRRLDWVPPGIAGRGREVPQEVEGVAPPRQGAVAGLVVVVTAAGLLGRIAVDDAPALLDGGRDDGPSVEAELACFGGKEALGACVAALQHEAAGLTGHAVAGEEVGDERGARAAEADGAVSPPPQAAVEPHAQVEQGGGGVGGSARLAVPYPRGEAMEPSGGWQIGHGVVRCEHNICVCGFLLLPLRYFESALQAQCPRF